ncbi:MAG: hypothetical protein D6806_16535 [Deltaproteobacteria bacterium]|nr:MAG: hypothetical protein D6806_16535 [Deltaproteobacteria bacterium]
MSGRAGLLLVVAVVLSACSRQNGVPDAGPTNITASTDVFWALQEAGYVVAKEKPIKSRQGCKSREYRAGKDGAVFRISVFDCREAERAAGIAANDHYRHVDSLLRNHREGGVLVRGAFVLIVRKEKGTGDQVADLMSFLSAL